MPNAFNQRLENLPPEIWSKITKIEKLKGQWIIGAQLSPQVLGRLKKSVLITSTGASTRIEGLLRAGRTVLLNFNAKSADAKPNPYGYKEPASSKK